MTKPRKGKALVQRRDAYGQEVTVNDRHLKDSDIDDQRVSHVPIEPADVLAEQLRREATDRLIARLTVPGLVALLTLLELLDRA